MGIPDTHAPASSGIRGSCSYLHAEDFAIWFAISIAMAIATMFNFLRLGIHTLPTVIHCLPLWIVDREQTTHLSAELLYRFRVINTTVVTGKGGYLYRRATHYSACCVAVCPGCFLSSLFDLHTVSSNLFLTAWCCRFLFCTRVCATRQCADNV